VTFADPNVERIVHYLAGELARPPGAPATLPGLEFGFESLYARLREEPEAVRALLPRLSGHGQSPAGRAWLALFGLCASHNGSTPSARAKLEAALRTAPTYTRVVAGMELARIVQASSGLVAAWELASALELAAAFQGVRTLTDQQLEGPLLGPACFSLLELSAANGAFAIADAVANAGRRLWASKQARIFEIELFGAEAEVARGEFTKALARVEQLETSRVRAGAQLRAACIELQARVTLGEAETELCLACLERCLALLEAASLDPLADDREQLRTRISWLASLSRALSVRVESTACAAPVASPAGDHSIADLFRLEAVARRGHDPARQRELLETLVSATEQHLQDPEVLAPDQELRLNLLWSWLVVELGLTQVFPFCRSVLLTAIARSRQLGSRPLEMQAHDQFSLLCARTDQGLAAALVHCHAATQLALALLAENSRTRNSASAYRRAYLEDLLPVLDRTLELQTELAVSIGKLPSFQAQVLDPFDERLFDVESPQGSWQRLGRSLQALTENAQALALREARLARESDLQEMTLPPPQLSPDTRPILKELQSRLREHDAVLQYFLVGRYVLVFAYGRGFFHWYAGIAVERAERAIEEWARELQDWSSGEVTANREGLDELQALLLPPALSRTLRVARVTHLRVVPHGALYRLPFGRLETGHGSVAASFSMSLHPTGRAAARAATHRFRPLRRRATLAHLVGPELSNARPIECGVQDLSALQRALGRSSRTARILSIDGSQQQLAAVVTQLSEYDVLHFLCHGQKGSALSPANLLVAAGRPATLTARVISELPLQQCRLVVLQSCWTGWLDHSRTNPVQGLPQAFTDAGAHAVIAPLTQVPVALAPVFTHVFYRALAFLPAERALHRALLVLRTYGAKLLPRDPEAAAAYAAWGSSFDTLEYRYTGASDVRFGSWLSRLIGRVHFWWFERRLSREEGLRT